MIHICIPTYNEERTIGVLLWKIRQVMAEFPRDYQILVLDDASTDATAEVLAPYTRVLPLTVMRNEERRGYAASMEALLREAVRRSGYPKRDIVVTLQADFTEEPEEIPALVKKIEGGADVVTSAAVLDTGDAPRALRWTRRVLGYLLRRGRWPDGITDPLSGFRAYRVIALKRALESAEGGAIVRGEGWAANVSLLRAVLPHARRVDETPVALRYDRRRRGTRFQPWDTTRQLLPFLRGGVPASTNGRNGRSPQATEPGAPVAVAGPAGVGREDLEAGERRPPRNGGRRGGARRGGRRRGPRTGGAPRGNARESLPPDPAAEEVQP